MHVIEHPTSVAHRRGAGVRDAAQLAAVEVEFVDVFQWSVRMDEPDVDETRPVAHPGAGAERAESGQGERALAVRLLAERRSDRLPNATPSTPSNAAVTTTVRISRPSETPAACSATISFWLCSCPSPRTAPSSAAAGNRRYASAGKVLRMKPTTCHTPYAGVSARRSSSVRLTTVKTASSAINA